MGTQVEAPVIVATGIPPTSTRTAPVIHCPVAHGGTVVPVSAQPVTAYGGAVVTTGWPDNRTRGLGAVGCAGPACEQVTTAPRWGCPNPIHWH